MIQTTVFISWVLLFGGLLGQLGAEPKVDPELTREMMIWFRNADGWMDERMDEWMEMNPTSSTLCKDQFLTLST